MSENLKKMLVVDDENEICEFLQLFFRDRGFDVATANSGEKALDKIQQSKPDIVLLDIHMPGMDGLATLKKIKQLGTDTKIIMVTAIETADKIDQAMRYGADNYITKPLSLEYLERDVNDKIMNLTRFQ